MQRAVFTSVGPLYLLVWGLIFDLFVVSFLQLGQGIISHIARARNRKREAACASMEVWSQESGTRNSMGLEFFVLCDSFCFVCYESWWKRERETLKDRKRILVRSSLSEPPNNLMEIIPILSVSPPSSEVINM